MSSLSKARWQLSDIPVELKDADALLHAAVSIVASGLKLNAENVEKRSLRLDPSTVAAAHQDSE